MNIFKTRSFRWWEVGLLKLCLISLGILIGLYFYDYVAGLLWLWLVLFAAIGAYFIIKFFRGEV